MNNEDLKKSIFSLHPLERKVLPHLEGFTKISDVVSKSKISEDKITTAIQLLEQRGITTFEKKENQIILLDTHGINACENDLPEIQLLKEISQNPKAMSKLSIPKELIGSAMGELKKLQLIEIKKENELILSCNSKGKDYLKTYSNPLLEFKQPISKEKLTQKQKQIIKEFSKRKGFLKEKIEKTFSYTLSKKGKELIKYFNKEFKGDLDLIETLSSDMLKTSSWKNKEFRHYETKIPTSFPQMGRKHPMLEANDILSKVFIEMGFKEMSGPLVESAFWNMDVMWIPQDHPARDEQDTFYLGDECNVPKDALKKVKIMHEKGLKKTHTPKGEFLKEISKKQLLRTHSTATSFRVLSELGEKQKKGEEINGKYFYLANVFRNEAVDATHLAEFYQGEGFIIGEDLSLADLMGFVKEYLSRLGFHQVKFKPTFNPYTEPSMEAHIYDEEIGKWYALINSGIFRPETLEPMGIKNKTIIAWGFGASRIAAKLANKESMRDITGATCDFEWLKTRVQMQRKVKGGDK